MAGKVLIIKGADFSANAIAKIDISEEVEVTPTSVTSLKINTDTEKFVGLSTSETSVKSVVYYVPISAGTKMKYSATHSVEKLVVLAFSTDVPASGGSVQVIKGETTTELTETYTASANGYLCVYHYLDYFTNQKFLKIED